MRSFAETKESRAPDHRIAPSSIQSVRDSSACKRPIALMAPSSASSVVCLLFLFVACTMAHPLQWPELPPFFPTALPFPWVLPLPTRLPPAFGTAHQHFPILDNLFLLLKATSCFNCTYFVSVDTPLSFTSPLSASNLHLLHYQVIPFNLPLERLTSFPLAFRIPSLVNDSYILVTSEQDIKRHSSLLTLNYQLLLAGDLFVSDYMVVHGITGFLAPFTLGIPFPGGV